MYYKPKYLEWKQPLVIEPQFYPSLHTSITLIVIHYINKIFKKIVIIVLIYTGYYTHPNSLLYTFIITGLKLICLIQSNSFFNLRQYKANVNETSLLNHSKLSLLIKYFFVHFQLLIKYVYYNMCNSIVIEIITI